MYALSIPQIILAMVPPATERLSRSKRCEAGASPKRQPLRLPLSAQWERVVGAVEQVIGRAEHAIECHHAARRRLDASDYELGRLREELAVLLQRRPAEIFTLNIARPAHAAVARPATLAA
ncbi:MAG TPA: hypothetical protein VNK52_15950 [Hyphomicrobiaceae bacterium]|nr:hypothetical protein [Hyphomicrobiaceae bacterium]